jgi:hypothetical protein
MEMTRSIRLALSCERGELKRTADIFRRVVESRCPAVVRADGEPGLAVELAITPGIGAEGYAVADGPEGGVRIVGNDPLGLLYGVGEFLHQSRYESGGFVPATWRGTSVPRCPVRGVYLAVHFGNFYEAAPAEEVQQYLEDLALWGLNAVVMHFPTWQFFGLDDPEARANIAQVRGLVAAARRVGIRAGLLQCANQGFKTAPAELLAAPYPDDWRVRGSLGVNVCPSRPQGRAYLLDVYGRLLDEFADLGLDFLVGWPYDEGGCGCSQCWPWGAKGYPLLFRDLAALARRKYPSIRTVLSAWMYDRPPAGEWEGLSALLAREHGWLDYVMADGHEDFPHYPLKVGVPGGLPLLSFPEISMWRMSPWGGFGANPLPSRLQALWDQVGDRLAGGFPYSEGIYEDINKVICAQFCWQKDRPAWDTVREYVSFEFSPDVADDILAAIEVLESDHERRGGVPARLEGAGRAFDLIRTAEARLTSQARSGWRWRLLYLRALMDYELARNGKRFEGPILRDAVEELGRIYHVSGRTRGCVRPPEVRC